MGEYRILSLMIHELIDRSFSAGGVVLVNDAKRITVDNTLDERLRLLEDRVTP